MKLLFIELLITSLTCTYCHKFKCTEKELDNLDLLAQKLYLVGSPDREYPTNLNQMKTFCKDNSDYQETIKQYSSRCLVKLSRQVFNLLMYSVNKNNENICKSRKRTSDFLQIGRCGNAAKNDTVKCWNKWITNLDGIKITNNHKMKLPLGCCVYYQFRACSHISYESLSRQCSTKAIEGQERLLDSYATDTLKLLCGDYTEDTDKCDKILHLVPESREKKLTKSPVLAIIEILDSIPEGEY